MEKMVVIVFENELKAYEGSKTLRDIDAEGSISIHAAAVITKNADGKVEVKDNGDEFPIRTIGGTAIGSLIGLLGGPIGMGIGAIAGSFTGFVLDMNRAGVDAEFLDSVSDKLTTGKWAVVADISEEWETPLDTRMTGISGIIFRAPRKNIEKQQDADERAAVKEEIAKLKKEQAKSRADQKAKIQAKIDSLNEKLQAKSELAKQRAEQQKAEQKAKIAALEKKASNAREETKAKIEARITEFKELDKDVNTHIVR